MPESALIATDLTAGHQSVPAVFGFDLTLDPGEIVSVLGPNGAGKTTTLLTLAGLLAPLSGSVSALGQKVNHKRPHVMARRGLRLVPDDRGLFASMTVRDHLRLCRDRPDPARLERVLDRFPVLSPLMSRKVGLLSGGEQQMLAIAGALLAAPRILMVDEMSLGLAPKVVEELLPALRTLARDEGIAVLLVEQHVDLALSVSDRAIVLNNGRVVLEGDASELLDDRDALHAAYFGAEDS
ncbi:ATP-binding cassette domain-containing protein [Gordonia sp. LSe1-13]|uniref:ATP-binding cassette domain-containing protein n=1 Tax=Gordonia sesuvii TaxID=3116777 RepID=A0ABU7M7F8_9ACTN|nr:ATP-binding cassette domain-containing protein [Gordonia sp. LSe1-13]